MPSTNNRLKVCTFNAKCDELDNKCCVTDHCYTGNRGHGVPDSLKAVMLAITLLPSRADIYNIQNVDKCVVPHLLKEFCRVKIITDRLDKFELGDPRLEAEQFKAVCDINNLTGLCPDAIRFRETLLACGEIDGLNYTDDLLPMGSNSNPALDQVYKYVGIDEYEAYHNGCVLTLIKKSLSLCPTAKEIPCIDSLVLFFEYEGRRLINVNVSLGGLSLSVEGMGCKKGKVDKVVCWLQQYKDCGDYILSGAFGDLDYDLDQLFYRGDALLPEFAQFLTTKNVENTSAPSSFPCNPEDPVYQFLEYLLKTCNAEHVPYPWLLQYIRVNGYKRCCAYNFVNGKKDCNTCKTECSPKAVCDRRKESNHKSAPSVSNKNRAALRAQKADRSERPAKRGHDGKHESKKGSCCDSCSKGGECDSKKSHSPSPKHSPKKSCCKSCVRGGVCEAKKPECNDKCVPKNGKCNNIKHTTCPKEDKCCVPLKKVCGEKTECKCFEKKDCHCCDTPYSVKVDVCRDFCDKKCNPCVPTCVDKCKKSCCEPCKKACKSCHKCKDVCDCKPCPEEKCPPFCDSLTVLKRELCLYNTLEKYPNANDRYTGFYNHYNKCLDCRYPRGIFQAWAMCEEYCLPKYPNRKIDNNSELLALDHILVSDSIKGFVSCSDMSDLKFNVSSIPTTLLTKNPFKTEAPAGDFIIAAAQAKVSGEVPDYSGVCVRSFFPNRVYCTDLRFPCEDDCGYNCGIDLDALGIKSLWCALDRWGSCEVSIDEMRKFCLDTHPFFEAFFYNTLRNKFQDKDLQGRYDREFGVCRRNNVVLRFRKNNKITDCEFFDAMVCAYTNSENKDRFVVTVSFIEAVVRAVRANKDTNVNSSAVVQNTHCEEIQALYDFLDVCFSGKLSFREYLERYPFLDIKNNGPLSVDVDSNVVTSFSQIVAAIIKTIDPYLRANCRLMEVLIRRAAQALDLAEINGVSIYELSPMSVDGWKNDIINQNAAFFIPENEGGCSVEEVKDHLPPDVTSSCSIIYLLEHCIKEENIIDFLMNITSGQFSA